MDISAVVLAYKTHRYIRKCLESIYNQRTNYSYEVIVVVPKDDHKTITVLNDLKSNFDFKVVHDKSIGAGPARNLGLKNARGDIVIFIDGDIILGENVFEDIRNKLSYEKIGTVSPWAIGYKKPICKFGVLYAHSLLKFINTFKPMSYTITLGCRRKEAMEIKFKNYWPGEDFDFVYRLNKRFNKKHLISKDSVVYDPCRQAQRGIITLLMTQLNIIKFVLTNKPAKIKYKTIE